MKKMLLLLLLIAGAFVAGAQKVYFLYLQSDSGAPFYVRIGTQVHSSTASGYAIIPGLRDSSYLLQVGFPGNTTELRFQVALEQEDRGFVLKQVGGAWNLFDLQRLTLTKALAAIGPSEEENRSLLAQADPFTRMLVQASDDMSLLRSGPSAPPAMLAADTHPQPAAVPVAAPATAVMASGVQIAAQQAHAIDTVPVAAEPAFARSVVTRRSESSTTEGFGLVFLDKQGETVDTIRLLIPNPVVAKKVDTPAVAVRRDTAAAPVAVPVAEVKKDTALVRDTVQQAAPRPDSVVKSAVSAVPADCKQLAEDKDFFKFRKLMAAESDEGNMVNIARKQFKGRCYTTEQVRNLSALFLTALGKYNFLEAAKGHVSDPDKFASLGAELKDEYFRNRFSQLLQ